VLEGGGNALLSWSDLSGEVHETTAYRPGRRSGVTLRGWSRGLGEASELWWGPVIVSKLRRQGHGIIPPTSVSGCKDTAFLSSEGVLGILKW